MDIDLVGPLLSDMKGFDCKNWDLTVLTNINRSPKGKMWSAIPVALLCMIVNSSERKQGSGPKGDEVL